MRHPDIQGVSVGAILSSYQRVRVEHVSVALNSPVNLRLTVFQMSAAWPYRPSISLAKGTGRTFARDDRCRFGRRHN